ncbi:MAG: dethiobiotin synthase [Actinobacteria bacterium]|nr:dethiobiotin synthase [Actinomycetota bacterium]
MRPAYLVVVTGTGTGVGKTWFTAVTLGLLRDRGVSVAARKPVQSFDPDDTEPRDVDVLAAATAEAPDVICLPHRSYARALAPPMAAEALGLPAFTIAELAAEVTWPGGVRVGAVEGAGGPRSPLAADGDTVDLIAAIKPDLVVLVANAGLGVINAAIVNAAPLVPRPVVVALNRFDDADDLHRRNRDWLRTNAALDVVTSPTDLADWLDRP